MSNYRNIKTAVIGVGSMGQNHARILSEISNLSYVFDFDHKQASLIGEKYSTNYYSNLDEIDESVDAVIISVPTEFHKTYVDYFSNQNSHILVEKPISKNVDEASHIVNLGHDSNITIAVGHIERFNPAIVEAKKLLDSGIWGEIITMSSKRVSNYPDRIRDVGVIADLGIHDIDLMRYISGSECSEIFSISGRTENPNFEDHASIIMRFDNEVKGIIEVNWLSPIKIRNLCLTCTDAYVEIDLIKQEIQQTMLISNNVKKENLYLSSQNVKTITIQVEKEEPLRLELLDFLGSIENNISPKVTAEEGKKSLELAIKALN